MSNPDWPLGQEPAFAEIWQKVEPYTMTSPQRGYALCRAVNYVIDNRIPGAFVECGVWKGGSMMLIALTLMARNAHRTLFLFDTFEGMTSPADIDEDFRGHKAAEFLKGNRSERFAELVAARATLAEVMKALLSTGYDTRLIYPVVGDVRATLPKTQTLQIALLRLDTDFYESTRLELIYLYPRVNKGGVIIVDDYGHWRGARKAVDEYFADRSYSAETPMLWAVDYTGRGFVNLSKAKNVEIQRYDYVPPSMIDPTLLELFPFAQPYNPWAVKWPYLRSYVPHIFRSDVRHKKKTLVGNASYEEAIRLHNIALQFAGKRGLEIGTHFGWTGAHIRAAGLEMDFVDPEFADPDRTAAVDEVMKAVDTKMEYRLWPLSSPQGIADVRVAAPEPWSFVFVDGNHDDLAPENDARAVLDHCAKDAVIVFHDMTSPFVARGLAVCKEAGWHVRLYNTMQVLGIAWRGDVSIPEHTQDPNVRNLFYPHLREYNSKLHRRVTIRAFQEIPESESAKQLSISTRSEDIDLLYSAESGRVFSARQGRACSLRGMCRKQAFYYLTIYPRYFR